MSKITKEDVLKSVVEEIVGNHQDALELARVDRKDVRENSNFRMDLGLDSLDIVELAYAVEKKYSVKFRDEDLIHVETIGDMVDLTICVMN